MNDGGASADEEYGPVGWGVVAGALGFEKGCVTLPSLRRRTGCEEERVFSLRHELTSKFVCKAVLPATIFIQWKGLSSLSRCAFCHLKQWFDHWQRRAERGYIDAI